MTLIGGVNIPGNRRIFLSVASGIYLYRVTSSTGFVDTKRMTLLK